MEPLDLVVPRIHPEAFVASTAIIYGDVTIGAGASILFGVVIRAELDRIDVGQGTNVQDGTVVHCDEGVPSLIGSSVTIGHAAVVHGATIGDHCLVGIGARALNGSVLGEGAWLAAGSILTEGKEIPPWTLAVGIPAKPVRELTPEEIERQRNGVQEYVRFGATYRALGA